MVTPISPPQALPPASEPPPPAAALVAPGAIRPAPRVPALVAPALVGLVARVRDGAARVLAAREPETDPEAVHDMRVALRRLRTVLRTCLPLYGKKRMRPVLRALRVLARASSALRDEEVLGQTLRSLALPAPTADDPQVALERAAAEWLARRAQAGRRLRRRVVSLLGREDPGGLDAALACVLELIAEGASRGPKLEPFARRALRLARRELRACLPVDAADAAGLHELRIRFKRLRYTAELLDLLHASAGTTVERAGTAVAQRPGAPVAESYAALARHAADLQRELGAVHDVDRALVFVARARSLSPTVRAQLRAALRQRRDELCAAALAHLTALPPEVFGGKAPLQRVAARTMGNP